MLFEKVNAHLGGAFSLTNRGVHLVIQTEPS